MGNRVFMKFEIHVPNRDPECLKEYLIKYKDKNKDHHHTLKNILLFNGIDVDDERAILRICYFENKKPTTISITLKEVVEYHVSYFYGDDLIPPST